MWLCSCGIKNAGLLDGPCTAAKTWKQQQHQQVSANTLDQLRIEIAQREVMNNMTPNEELFATYYNRGKILVKDMDDTSLREHREQLRQIATEAKAQLMASDDEIRERAAKKSLKDKEWLVSVDTSQSVSDAINVVEKRRARMSKMDKLKQQLIAAGIDDATVKTMVSDLERRATDQTLKTVTFKRTVTEDAAIQVAPKKPDDSAEPFDWSKLGIGQKE